MRDFPLGPGHRRGNALAHGLDIKASRRFGWRCQAGCGCCRLLRRSALDIGKDNCPARPGAGHTGEIDPLLRRQSPRGGRCSHVARGNDRGHHDGWRGRGRCGWRFRHGGDRLGGGHRPGFRGLGFGSAFGLGFGGFRLGGRGLPGSGRRWRRAWLRFLLRRGCRGSIPDQGQGCADGKSCAELGLERLDDPVLEDLDFDGAFLGFDHRDHVTAMNRIAGLDQPFDQLAVFHVGAEGRHDEDTHQLLSRPIAALAAATMSAPAGSRRLRDARIGDRHFLGTDPAQRGVEIPEGLFVDPRDDLGGDRAAAPSLVDHHRPAGAGDRGHDGGVVQAASGCAGR
jgi:hypothetical protein